MARYTCSYSTDVSLEELESSLQEIFQASKMQLLYNNSDYFMAREIIGKAPFNKLVTVEVVIDKTKLAQEKLRLNFAVKNAELPLKTDNYCRQAFTELQKIITEQTEWQSVQTVTN